MIPKHRYQVTEIEDDQYIECPDCDTHFELHGETDAEKEVHMMVILSYFEYEGCAFAPGYHKRYTDSRIKSAVRSGLNQAHQRYRRQSGSI